MRTYSPYGGKKKYDSYIFKNCFVLNFIVKSGYTVNSAKKRLPDYDKIHCFKVKFILNPACRLCCYDKRHIRSADSFGRDLCFSILVTERFTGNFYKNSGNIFWSRKHWQNILFSEISCFIVHYCNFHFLSTNTIKTKENTLLMSK